MPSGRRVYRFLRSLVIWLPAFLLVCALLLPWLPDSTGLFSDSAGPWYQPVTAALFFAVLMYAYPVTQLCIRLVNDSMFFSPGYYAVLAIYTALWILFLRALFSFFERRAARGR